MMRARTLAVLALAAGCTDATHTATPLPDSAVVAPPVDAAPPADLGSATALRPYGLQVPAGYDKSKPTPLVIALHGYGGSGPAFIQYFGLDALADAKGFLLAYPTGLTDSTGKTFWNATNACCSFYGGPEPPDDVAYLGAIIDDVAARYHLDAKRVWLVGHSNGGFMSHRFACDAAPRVAAIVSLAGAQWKDPTRCKPAAPVSVLQVHSDVDETIHYEGGHIGDLPGSPTYPSAHETIGDWAMFDGCGGALAPTGMMLHVDRTLPDPDTQVERQGGCPAGVGVELWTIHGAKHSPMLVPTWAETIYGFLSAHPRP